MEKVKDLEGYNQASNQYQKKKAELENQKRNDLIKYLELENYPKDKVEKLFKYVDTYVMESLSEPDNEYYLEVLNDFADLIRDQTALLGQAFQDRLDEIAITRTLAPATGLVSNYVVSTRTIDSNVNQQVTAYRTLDEAMADYKGRFNKLKQSGDMATIQLLTTIGTVVLDVFVKTQS